MKASFAVGGVTKTIVDSIMTSGFSPEEVLKNLDSRDVQWYVTKRGDLFLRYWQLGAEDFVPVEHIATIRENQSTPPEASALEWLSEHLRDIKARYTNRWIAIVNNQVVADSEDLTSLLQSIHGAGILSPFVTFVSGGPIIWATAYGQ